MQTWTLQEVCSIESCKHVSRCRTYLPCSSSAGGQHTACTTYTGGLLADPHDMPFYGTLLNHVLAG
jgi:hypothetical protein